MIDCTTAPTITLHAPELRADGERACVTTPAGIVIGGAYVRPPRRDAQAISGPHRRERPVARALLQVIGSTRAVLWLVALCAAALLLTACSGPSDIQAASDTAADLQDAQQQARAEIHHAQALALMAASGHK